MTYYPYILSIILVFASLSSCKDNEFVVPPFDPEITFNTQGEVNVRFESQGTVTIENSQKVLKFGSSSKINNQDYSIAFIFRFKDSIKTGNLFFGRNPNIPDSSYATAAFIVGTGDKAEMYFSDSGNVVLTNVSGTRIYGTFNFIASTDKGKFITVNNGLLQANQ